MRRLYGAGPVHLLLHLALFALTAIAALRVAEDPLRLRYLVWFVAAAVLHDLLLLPLYSLADTGVRRALPGAALNAVRVPALLSGLLLLVFAPVILRRSEPAFGAAAGLDQSPYLSRWLLITGVLFAGSGLLFAARRLRGRPRPAPPA